MNYRLEFSQMRRRLDALYARVCSVTLDDGDFESKHPRGDDGRFGSGGGEGGENSNDAKLKGFVASAIKNRNEKQKLVVQDEISSRTRNRIMEKTEVDVGNARVEVFSDNVRHSQNKHPDLDASDWAKLPKLVDHFDDVKKLSELGEHGETRIGFIMNDNSTGYAYAADVRIGKNKGERLAVITFFKDHPNSVKDWLENG